MNLIDQLNITHFELTMTEINKHLTYHFVSQMSLSDFHAQPQGFLNGGATLAFAEITAGMASNQVGAGRFFAVGQTISANHLNPKKSEGVVTAEGTLLKNGKYNHVWDIKILTDNQTLISQITVVNALIHEKEN